MRFPAFLLAAVLWVLTAGPARASEFVAARNQHGDDPRWAAPDWDDRSWAQGRELPARSGIFWMRFGGNLEAPNDPVASELARVALTLGDEATVDRVDCIYLAAPFAYELFWDGRKLGGSGATGSRRGESLRVPVNRREGTGLRFVRARLEESFPGRWTLTGAPTPEGWRTVIEIKDEPAAATETNAASLLVLPEEKVA